MHAYGLQFRQARGYVLKVPAVDIAEVGAGGGSLAWIDAGGLLCVGPASAGASPLATLFRYMQPSAALRHSGIDRQHARGELGQYSLLQPRAQHGPLGSVFAFNHRTPSSNSMMVMADTKSVDTLLRHTQSTILNITNHPAMAQPLLALYAR